MEEDRPKVGIGVYIYNDKGQILLLKRHGARGQASWHPPGGHLELGETWEKCAHRETKEEVGIKIKNLEFFGVTNDVFAPDIHYITIAIKAKLKSGKAKVMEPKKATQIGWFSPNNLPHPLFLPVKNFLKKYKI